MKWRMLPTGDAEGFMPSWPATEDPLTAAPGTNRWTTVPSTTGPMEQNTPILKIGRSPL